MFIAPPVANRGMFTTCDTTPFTKPTCLTLKPRHGPQLKFKFVATLSAVVAKINIQRSVELGLFNGRSLVSCGNVTIPANHEIPTVGTVVEARYLYAAKESGVLYQPVYLGPRDDVDPGECLVSQLKFKAE